MEYKILDQNKVSIIIPVYDVQEYLAQCIDSILVQTYKNIEIILINDGSNDNCGIICDQYAKKDSRIIVIHQKNKGVSCARNVGIERATGKYLCFIDADDFINPQMINYLVKTIENTKSECAVCLPKCFEAMNFSVTKYLISEGSVEILNLSKAVLKLFDVPATIEMAAWNKIFVREIIYKHDLKFDYSMKYSEDLKFVLNYFKYCKSIAFLPLELIYIRKRVGSATRKKISFDEFLYNMNCLDECSKLACHLNSDAVGPCIRSKFIRIFNRREEIIKQKMVVSDENEELNLLRKYMRKNMCTYFLHGKDSFKKKMFSLLFALGIKH